MINKKTRTRLARPLAGFTLIETLIAILILTVSIVGPLTIASKGLNTALIAKDKTVATFLAQDAIEFIRYKRDTNRLNNQSWLSGLDASTCSSADGSRTCEVLSISGYVNNCSGTCRPLNYDSSSNTYLYAGGVSTVYTRTVSIQTPVCSGGGVCNASEAQVKVVVSWKDVGNVQRSVSVIENLLDWQ